MVDLPPETLVDSVREAIEAHILVPVEMRRWTGLHVSTRPVARGRLRRAPAGRAGTSPRSARRSPRHAHEDRPRRRPDVVADLAVHAYHAHDLPRALQGSVRALDAFAAVHANQEAFDHAQRALELWPRSRQPRRWPVSTMPPSSPRRHASRRRPGTRIGPCEMALDALEELDPADADRRVDLLSDTFWFAWEVIRLERATSWRRRPMRSFETRRRAAPRRSRS